MFYQHNKWRRRKQYRSLWKYCFYCNKSPCVITVNNLYYLFWNTVFLVLFSCLLLFMSTSPSPDLLNILKYSFPDQFQRLNYTNIGHVNHKMIKWAFTTIGYVCRTKRASSCASWRTTFTCLINECAVQHCACGCPKKMAAATRKKGSSLLCTDTNSGN